MFTNVLSLAWDMLVCCCTEINIAKPHRALFRSFVPIMQMPVHIVKIKIVFYSTFVWYSQDLPCKYVMLFTSFWWESWLLVIVVLSASEILYPSLGGCKCDVCGYFHCQLPFLRQVYAHSSSFTVLWATRTTISSNCRVLTGRATALFLKQETENYEEFNVNFPWGSLTQHKFLCEKFISNSLLLFSICNLMTFCPLHAFFFCIFSCII